MHVSFQIRVFSRCMPRSGITGSYDNFFFLRNLHTALHSSVIGHLGCLTYNSHILAIICCYGHWDACPGVGLLGHMVTVFKESLYCSPSWLHQFVCWSMTSGEFASSRNHCQTAQPFSWDSPPGPRGILGPSLHCTGENCFGSGSGVTTFLTLTRMSAVFQGFSRVSQD